ncbi:hypothetical protein GGR10_000522 [Bartonella chomelii]|uniref:Uncharacterized protein n=1 Tax=Bartonella chomelii TaxID=236402 RepID=A0ABR6E3H3_9HYPH|nr:hypothetical protein [Bartonella chomelii]
MKKNKRLAKNTRLIVNGGVVNGVEYTSLSRL